MNMYSTILLAEDDAHTRKGIQEFLEGLDYDVMIAENGKRAWELYQQEKPDLVLSDIRMPELDGVALLEKIHAANPFAKVILLTAYGTVDNAVQAMKKGAYHYLTKPVNLDELEFLVKKALTSTRIEEENKELRQALFRQKFDAGQIIAESKIMKDLLKTVEKIAHSNATVLIEGESGTGKELIANRIHELSARSGKPFVPVHCAALTETLLASELFGHEKGSFTGATERKIGRFERAHQGSLFLDEIGEISKETQVKLLRVLQDGTFERVGSAKSTKVDVRLICATNRNLLEEVKKGNFREDLYYRINVIYLKVPPLRDRKEDLALLVNYFIEQFAKANGKNIRGITPGAMKMLSDYEWPGNIREVKNIIERMIVLSSGKDLTEENVPDDIKYRTGGRVSAPAENGNGGAGQSEKIHDMERELIARILREANGNKSVAAKKLGISRRTLYRKLDEYGF